MVAEVDAAKKDADTLGGIVEVLAYGVPPGLGSHVQWDRKLDARLATALMSIQAIKGVEIGDAFTQARSRGSQAHDEIMPTATGVRRLTDRAGGLEGGITTGEPLRVRAAMKPISSLNRALATVDVATGEPATAINQRSDVCAVPGRRGGRRGDGGAGAGRGGDGEVRRRLGRRDPPQPRRLPRQPGDPVMAPGRACSSAPPGAGKTTVGRAGRRRARRARSATPTPTSRRRPASRSRRSSSTTARTQFRALERAAVAAALESFDGVLALGGGAVLAEETRARCAGHTWCT